MSVVARRVWVAHALSAAPLLLFGLVLACFGVLAPRFFVLQNFSNIAVQASSTAIVATGMTFVLVTAGVDLSVGAIMFIAAAVAGKLLLGGAPFVVVALIVAGALCGACNAFFITRFKIVPFIVTLATLYIGRGFALWLTQTRAMNLPEPFLHRVTMPVAGVPAPLLILAVVVIAGQIVLSRTPFGRQLYAIGSDRETARKAGIEVERLLAAVYIVSGICAAIGAVVSLGQLGAVSPTFGLNREFTAIAAAVLGGTSLFGGRGTVFPGALLGALLMQTIENGLVILNTDPYLYPLVTSAIIFVAVLLDSLRTTALKRALVD